MKFGLLQFEEQYMERIWGGEKLNDVLGKPIPQDKPIGEAWVVSDHPSAVSKVSAGPRAGQTLHDLIDEDSGSLLGSQAALTVHGRFPLLLKILDANDVLSVQVHPDDETAERLGEPDVGKTEMWHVLQAEPGSELICGLKPEVEPEAFRKAVDEERLEECMVSFPVEPGASVFVAAGSVHAIGAGIVLAEIQQNSDLTYRLYDWGRVQDDGSRRELHIDKGLEAIHFDSQHTGANHPLTMFEGATKQTVLAACRYFAAELLELNGQVFQRNTGRRSFHILLGKSGLVRLGMNGEEVVLKPGEAAMVPGHAEEFSLGGRGTVLDYYVPDLKMDIAGPLYAAGFEHKELVRLGGDPRESDLRHL
jgi:mannose-6-phosphate isomerase